jgi:hypothetical protein
MAQRSLSVKLAQIISFHILFFVVIREHKSRVYKQVQPHVIILWNPTKENYLQCIRQDFNGGMNTNNQKSTDCRG